MGFNSVYRILQEVFPQVDSRMLRAVAIEHSKDADVAVEVVLHEVIPCLNEQSLKVSSPNKNKSSLHISEDAGCFALEGARMVEPVTMELGSQSSLHDANGELGSVSDGVSLENSKVEPEKPPFASFSGSGSYVNHDQDSVTIGVQNVESSVNSSWFVQKEAALRLDCELLNQISHFAGNLDDVSSALICENGCNDNNDEECDTNKCQEVVTSGNSFGFVQEEAALHVDFEHLNQSSHIAGNPDNASSALICENGFHDNHDQECITNESQDVATLGNSSGPFQEEAALHVVGQPMNQLGANPELQSAVNDEFGSSSSTTNNAFMTEMVSLEDASTMGSVLTRSDQICSTEFLEDIIEEARDNKKILVSAMDSVVNLMREVECKEKAAEEAKEEAGRGCSDIIAKVDEVKQALLHAKEANDMHAGEVYAEKAILATEVKELQLRLLNLSDEKDKSLGILDEMRKALEIRLAASMKEIEAAEEEKQEKQRFAREALAYQEKEMEKVVEESKRLKLEAEENSKLQDFLMDRGRAIDVLQGEISVKCQDIKLLKEKFDKGIPLGRSLSWSQASSVLASTGSSLKSCTSPSEPEPEPEPETSESQKKKPELADSYGLLEESSSTKQAQMTHPLNETVYSVDDHFTSGEEKQIDDRKLLLDDGWELFDA